MAAAPAHFWIEAFNVSNQEDLFQANVGYWPFLVYGGVCIFAGVHWEKQQAN